MQLLEGYWPARGGSFLFRLGVWRQRRRRDRLVDAMVVSATALAAASWDERRALGERMQISEQSVRTWFPTEDRLLPTGLGNVLRSAEDRLGERYGVDAVVVWPRLFRLLPEAVARDIDDEVTQMDVSARLATTWLFTAVAAVAVLLVVDAGALVRNWEWLTVPLGLVALSWLSYRGAIESALAHAVDIEVGLDLYRGRVIDAMRLPEPRRLSEERRQFAALMELFTSYEEDEDMDLVFRRAPDVAPLPLRRTRSRGKAR
ncbi:hypothetical protein [Cellulomonas humilata]|uniref:HTH tetR-type domain-containing protein n=1 Tax=Cellulomonas humilata TaxID=144055 RepID=A0ABU0ELR1_9CELL|nr:hypothetical protein [Cellulomonas humilata]MDQ0375981.1 hypothetical protein [Cellulomonas humilata]